MQAHAVQQPALARPGPLRAATLNADLEASARRHVFRLAEGLPHPSASGWWRSRAVLLAVHASDAAQRMAADHVLSQVVELTLHRRTPLTAPRTTAANRSEAIATFSSRWRCACSVWLIAARP
jgi:hypothetical protein